MDAVEMLEKSAPDTASTTINTEDPEAPAMTNGNSNSAGTWFGNLMSKAKIAITIITIAATLFAPIFVNGNESDGGLKVIVDTDAGADDAAAILFLASFSDIKLIGITCVYGNTQVDNVVQNVLKTLQVSKRLQIPVFRGATQSIISARPVGNYFGEDGLGDFNYPDPPDVDDYLQDEHASSALVKLISENPGEVTLICLGPLTNIALAIRQDPEFLVNLKELIILGGSVEGVGNIKPGIEFNFYSDPEAAFIVFSEYDLLKTKAPSVKLIPWETVYSRNHITSDWRNDILGTINNSKVIFLNKAETIVSGYKYPNWLAGDLIAAAIVVERELIQLSEKHHIDVETEGRFARGAVFVDYTDIENSKSNAEIIKTFNIEQYQKLLVDSFTKVPEETEENVSTDNGGILSLIKEVIEE